MQTLTKKTQVRALEFQRQCHGTIAAEANAIGVRGGEPLIHILDSMLRYAEAYRQRNGVDLAQDCVLGPAWISAIQAIHVLFDGTGAIAMERGLWWDSKDNSFCEGIYWDALEVAGFCEDAELGRIVPMPATFTRVEVA